MTAHSISRKGPSEVSEGGGAPEVEVTAEMIEAGLQAYLKVDLDCFNSSEVFLPIFRAMEGARVRAKP
jgi:hypothetical protein